MQILSLLLNGLTWTAVTCMLCIEWKVYVRDLIWYVRFGAVYVVVAEFAKGTYVVALRDYFAM